MRVLTWNLNYGFDDTADPDAPGYSAVTYPETYAIYEQAAFIASLSPDIVFVQEYEQDSARSLNVDQVAVIAAACGLSYTAKNSLTTPAEIAQGYYPYGQAIISRYPLVETEENGSSFELTFANQIVGRFGAAIAKANIDGMWTRLVSVHFVAGNIPTRLLQLAELGALMTTSPIIVGGDFNDVVDSSTYTAALTYWPTDQIESLTEEPLHVDYVFSKNVAVGTPHYHSGNGLSDHNLYYVDLPSQAPTSAFSPSMFSPLGRILGGCR